MALRRKAFAIAERPTYSSKLRSLNLKDIQVSSEYPEEFCEPPE
jgi:hypothetical protein